jgi:hypothetical protein
MERMKRKLAVGGAAALAVAGGGVAVAANQWSGEETSDAVVADAAAELGVEPAELTDALQQALSNRVDEAVEAGRLTEEQGAELKERIESGDFPLFGGPHRGGMHHHGFLRGLDEAAQYLGLSKEELRAELADGKTLAEVAREQDKTVDGLVDALVNEAKQDLNTAVEEGRLTEEQRNAMLENLEERITDLVNGELRGPTGPRMERAPGRDDTTGWGFAAPGAPL